ncbi:hypothetical protein RND81_03G034300 [Saponaria officinalis]|uniref:Uncharacterized protein n=1 Tax=Saponaria officinalis TaxID=3572 RepID=A0AAW1M473_SAPOF
MENTTRHHPSLPSNYVTILDLKERWLKQQQKEQREEEIDTTKQAKEKGKITVDGEISGKSEPELRHYEELKPSVNANLNRGTERGFRRNPNWKNRRTFHRGFDGEKRSIMQYRAVKTPEINGAVKIEADIDDRDQVKSVQKKMKRRMRKKMVKERRRIEENKEGVKQITVSKTENQTAEIEAKMPKMEVFVTKKRVTVSKTGNQTAEIEAKMPKMEVFVAKKRVTVLKTGNLGVNDQTVEIEENMKEVFVAAKQVTASKTGNLGLNDQTVEIEENMKEVFVLDKRVPVIGTHYNVIQEKQNPVELKKKDVIAAEKRFSVTGNRNVSKNVGRGEVRWSGRRINCAERNRDKGLMWVKKGEVLRKSKNCCIVDVSNYW